MLLQALTAVAVIVAVAAAHLLSAMGHLALLLLNFEALRPRLASARLACAIPNIYSLPQLVNTNFHFLFSIFNL